MYIDKVRFKNYKNLGVDYYSIDLKRNHVIYSESGDTANNRLVHSMFQGITHALSIFFARNKWGYQSLNHLVKDLNITNIDLDEFIVEKPLEVRVNAKMDDGTLISWSYYKDCKPTARPKPNFYKDAYCVFYDKVAKSKLEAYPVFAYYSDMFNQGKDELNIKLRQVVLDDVMDRSWGYYHFDNPIHTTNIWQLRFIGVLNRYYACNFDLERLQDKTSPSAVQLQKQIDAYTNELNYITDTLKVVFDDIEEIRLSNTMSEIEVKLSDSKFYTWGMLPKYLNRICNIVFDLSYRNYILNGQFDKGDAGFVIIENIELDTDKKIDVYGVLNKLIALFPKTQFLVSTNDCDVVSLLTSNK